MLARCVLVALAVAGAACDQVIINEAIDQLLESARLAMKIQGSNKISMKDIEKDFKAKIFGVQVPGSFSASKGYLEDLSTLHRTGDVAMSTEGSVLKLKASIGFGLLHVFFGEYDFKFLRVTSSGTMEVSMAGSSASAAISVVRSGDKCVVSVDSASLDNLGELKVKLSGPQVLNQFITMLLNWVLENFHGTIQVVANSKLAGALKEGLVKTDLCKKLPH